MSDETVTSAEAPEASASSLPAAEPTSPPLPQTPQEIRDFARAGYQRIRDLLAVELGRVGAQMSYIEGHWRVDTDESLPVGLRNHEKVTDLRGFIAAQMSTIDHLLKQWG